MPQLEVRQDVQALQLLEDQHVLRVHPEVERGWSDTTEGVCHSFVKRCQVRANGSDDANVSRKKKARKSEM